MVERREAGCSFSQMGTVVWAGAPPSAQLDLCAV